MAWLIYPDDCKQAGIQMYKQYSTNFWYYILINNVLYLVFIFLKITLALILESYCKAGQMDQAR